MRPFTVVVTYIDDSQTTQLLVAHVYELNTQQARGTVLHYIRRGGGTPIQVCVMDGFHNTDVEEVA